MKRLSLSLGLAALFGLLATGAVAQVTSAPSLMNFQGRLTKPDGTPVANGTYTLKFSLFDAATGGTEKWTQTLNTVQVANGTFAVLLNTNASQLFDVNLWLEIKIGTDAPLTPRQQLVSVAYAMKANTVPDGSITADKLANDALNNLSWLLGGNNGTNPTSNFLGTKDNQPLVFRTNNTEKMRLLANGNFGIGTNSAATKLHLQDGSFRLGNTADNKNYELAYDATGDYFYIDEFGAARRFVIKNGGNVGIGTLTPIQMLDVGGRMNVANGVIQRGGLPITTTSDLGLYSQVMNNWMRFVTNGGDFKWFADSGAGTEAIMSLSPSGELTANVVTVLGGSDVAEPYNVAPAGKIAPIPGYVVAIDPDKVGQMRVVSKAYDPTVAGIISGANGINPGITLRQKGTIADGELPVASIGRVWCWCDADQSGPIVAGDLLTTSDTPGHAMKAVDRERRDGAIIGKAMSSLKSGSGLVLVLVSLK